MPSTKKRVHVKKREKGKQATKQQTRSREAESKQQAANLRQYRTNFGQTHLLKFVWRGGVPLLPQVDLSTSRHQVTFSEVFSARFPLQGFEQLFLPSPCKHCKAFRILQEQQPSQFDMGVGEVGNLKSTITIIYITSFTPLNIPLNPHAKGKCVEHDGRNSIRDGYSDFMLSWKNRATHTVFGIPKNRNDQCRNITFLGLKVETALPGPPEMT